MVEVFGNIFLSSPESFLHLKGCTALQPDTGGWPLGMKSLFKKKENLIQIALWLMLSLSKDSVLRFTAFFLSSVS